MPRLSKTTNRWPSHRFWKAQSPMLTCPVKISFHRMLVGEAGPTSLTTLASRPSRASNRPAVSFQTGAQIVAKARARGWQPSIRTHLCRSARMPWTHTTTVVIIWIWNLLHLFCPWLARCQTLLGSLERRELWSSRSLWSTRILASSNSPTSNGRSET